MQLVPAGGDQVAEAKTLFQQRESRALGPLPGFFGPDQPFNLSG